MPRRPRQKSATNFYHVVVRGLNKIAVFQDKREKTRILNLIRENYEEYNIKIYAYCIMSNHFHLLLETELKELASFMAKIIASFAHYYNYKHNRTGYVFQDRFKSQCIETGEYFWSCLRYIHLNPVKAGMCKNIEDYMQSSVGEYNHQTKSEERILAEAAYVMYEKRFQRERDFMDFHKLNDRDFFIGMPEEELWQRKEIAKEVLKDMQYELKLPVEEILDYSKTRMKFEERLTETFNISQRYVKDIRKAIEREMGQGK